MKTIDALHDRKHRYKAEAYTELLELGLKNGAAKVDPFGEPVTERLAMSLDPIIDSKIDYVMRNELGGKDRSFEAACRLVLLRGEHAAKEQGIID